jgi:Holliday junction resolvasome RuvABC endonuclease subunit
MTIRVLSIDISASSTGYAFYSGVDDKIFRGLIETSSKYSRAERLSKYRSELSSIIEELKPTHIVMEDVYSGPNVKTLVLLSKFAGVTEECCLSEFDITPHLIHNGTVKAYFKVKNKEGLFNVVIDILDWVDAVFKKHNDMTDAVGQLMCYHDSISSNTKFRYEKEYGYLYKIGE